MSLTLTFDDHGETVVVCCHGKLVAGSTDLLYQPVARLIPTHKVIILDLAELTHMDSMGLGALLRLYVSARARGCSVQLRHLSKKVRELLIMTNLISVFSVIGEHHVRM